MAVRIETIESMPFAENTYILWKDGASECVVVDPGFEPNLIFDFLAAKKLRVAAILNTHGHVDHIAGNQAMKAAHPHAPLIIGHGDAIMLNDPVLNLSAGYGMSIASPLADRTVKEAEVLELAGMQFAVSEIPGHSPGHVVFYLPSDSMVLGGDVLFRESVGRTDFPGGSMKQLVDGIKAKLWPLPEATVVYPGHGEPTTIGHEKRANPFVNI